MLSHLKICRCDSLKVVVVIAVVVKGPIQLSESIFCEENNVFVAIKRKARKCIRERRKFCFFYFFILQSASKKIITVQTKFCIHPAVPGSTIKHETSSRQQFSSQILLSAHWLDLVMRVLLFRVPETCCFKPKCKASHIYKKETSLNTIPKYQNTKNCQKLPKNKIGVGGRQVYSF